MTAPWTWQHPTWPSFSVGDDALTERARTLEGKIALLNKSVSWVSQKDAEDLQIATLCQEGVATAAIEGQVIDPGAIRSSIAKKLGLASAGWIRPPREVDGLISALLDATEQWDKPLTAERLFAWQAALFPDGRSGLERVLTGKFRTDDINIISGGPMGKPVTVHYQAPPASRVAAEMEIFLLWFNAWDGRRGLERAAIAHAWFEAIHPFEDGNGRVGRIIIDLAMAQNEKSSKRLFSLSRELEAHRKGYVDALGELNHPDPGKPLSVDTWFGVFLQSVSDAVVTSQLAVDMAIKKNLFWSTWSHVSLNDRQRKVLNKLIDAGPGSHAGGINNNRYASMGQTSRATATRDLAELVVSGILLPSKSGGRSKSYSIDWTSLGVAPGIDPYADPADKEHLRVPRLRR